MMRPFYTFWVISIMMHSCHTIPKRRNNSEKTVLVFGGNGQVGTEFVHRLLQHKYKPVLVSRGRYWHYDSGTLIKPNVTHIPCDRYENTTGSQSENLLERCTTLMQFINGTEHIDFVIDFTTNNQKVIRDAADVLRGKVGLYIYMSTHAVYEVCERAKKRPVEEKDCVRPKNETERQMLTIRRPFIDGKKQAEEFLVKQRSLGGFPYTIFRLGDVIGPRCTSAAWWQLQLWIQYYHIIKSKIWIDNLYVYFNGSLVFTKDVAKAIHSAMEAGQIVHDQIYNVAFDRPFNFKSIANAIAEELQVKGIKYKTSPWADLPFPTVYTGPMDISKIKNHLGFQPTPWEDALKDTVAWFENAYYDYPKYLKSMIFHHFRMITNIEIEDELMEAIYNKSTKDEL